ncbi:MAG: Rieske (2Fe-2S) protein [Alphaproteobacteria bacterium]|nr:Rieske (2Fe-2S) protein [Alphaproteobacteria bacterium]
MSTMLEASATEAGKLNRIRESLDTWFVKDAESGRFRLDREVFTDPDLFELEMKHIFERNWIFLGHESQLAKPNDFMTAYIGRQPVLLSRTRSGELKCFINACSHRGARICRERAGNKKNFTCPFHGWTYSTAGELLDVTDQAQGGYLPTFDRADYALEEIGRLESYRGFIFGSLSPDVVPLEDYLAGAKTMIDLMVDQSPAGEWEVLRGATRYTYKGNWKLQAENGLDGYHIGNVHASYFMTVQRRFDGKSTNDTKAFDFGTWDQLEGGSFSFHNGHSVLWNDYANFQDRPNYELLDWLKQKYGADLAKWMNGRIRNLLLFPNVFLMDQTSTQIRILRPISVDETEVITYCIAPVGESAKARALRIRQYEDFFNASGMATPDDLTEFNNCQIGFGHGPGRYNDMSRGASRFVRGANDHGKAINLNVVMSGEQVADEGLYIAIHEDWVGRMKAAVAEEMNELAEAAE